jgi:hypothetical protein
MPGIQERAEKAFQKACPADLSGRILRTTLDAADGTLVVYAFLPSDVSEDVDPFRLLRRNAMLPDAGIMTPMVLDAESGRPAGRIVIPYELWADAEKLKTLWQQPASFEKPREAGSELRLLKGVPDDVSQYRYGRSGRYTLLLDRRPSLLAARVFPGGLAPVVGEVPVERLRRAAWMLLARSSVTPKPCPFHMLRGESFFQVERAVAMPSSPARETVKVFELELIRGAEEDRVILTTLFQTPVPWERDQKATKD